MLALWVLTLKFASKLYILRRDFRYFSDIDWNLASKKMRKPGWIFDTRNIVNHAKVKESGLNLWMVGKNY